MTTWPDITGITESGGRPRLPRRPEVVARALSHALRGAETRAALVGQIVAETRADPVRVEGLLGWLPLSHVAWWDPSTGELGFDHRTTLHDIAVRFAAWVGSQPVPQHETDALLRYTRAVVEAARTLGPQAVAPGGPSRPPTPGHDVTPQAQREPLVPPELTQRLRTLLGALDGSFLERHAHVRAALLALISRQHVLLVGPPGTAKSQLARALCRCFADARYFEYLLSRFTHPDELFGPVSIPGLKEEDYRRLTEGFLPAAHVGFLDEIFKANSAILNSLLTLVNERLFHHGRHRDAVPLIGLIGASNELPDPEGGLGALFDRFLVRLTVPPLAGPEAFLSVATGRVPSLDIPSEARLTPDDLQRLHDAADQVEVSDELQGHLLALWHAAKRAEWSVSDRRWRQAVHLLKVAAAADGRRRLVPLDLLLLEPVLASDPALNLEVRELILERLGGEGVPRHDLRAQWLLLRDDRVAPLDDSPLPRRQRDDGWRENLPRRAHTARRFLEHHQQALSRLAADRATVEDRADAHLWIRNLPSGVLSAHIEASRDLAGILEVAERYARDVSSPQAAARAIARRIPVTKRVYGGGAAVVLNISNAKLQVPLTHAGERLAAHGKSTPHLTVEAEHLLDWLDRRLATRELFDLGRAGQPELSATSTRDALGALESMARQLDWQAVPQPVDLPAP